MNVASWTPNSRKLNFFWLKVPAQKHRKVLPDLGLELVNQELHALVVLAIFIRGKSQLLDVTLRLAKVLHTVSHSAVLGIEFGFQLPDPCLHLVHCLLASLQGAALSFVQAGLK